MYNLQTNWKKIMSDKDEQDELERLRRENAALKKGASPGARMKVSEKGALSVYGMGRFPVTLYKEQWLKLLDMTTTASGLLLLAGLSPARTAASFAALIRSPRPREARSIAAR